MARLPAKGADAVAAVVVVREVHLPCRHALHLASDKGVDESLPRDSVVIVSAEAHRVHLKRRAIVRRDVEGVCRDAARFLGALIRGEIVVVAAA